MERKMFMADHPSRVTLLNDDWIYLLDVLDDLLVFTRGLDALSEKLEGITENIYGQLKTGEDLNPHLPGVETIPTLGEEFEDGTPA